jgi:tetratricopeptide (TPR) repeat protein
MIRLSQWLKRRLQVNSNDVSALTVEGMRAGGAMQLDYAQDCFQIALRLAPGSADAWFGLGNIHTLRNQQREALAAYKQAAEFLPAHGPAWVAQINAALSLGQEAEVRHAIQGVLLSGCLGESLGCRVLPLLLKAGWLPDLAWLQTQLGPDDPRWADVLRVGAEYHYRRDHYAQAVIWYRRLCEIAPQCAGAWNGLGLCHYFLGRLDTAEEYFNHAISADPGHLVARWHRALLRLMRHDYSGWEDYELRHINPDQKLHGFGLSRWHGQSVPGRRVLVLAEQGIGDQIMFSSCLPDLQNTGAEIVLDCHPKLTPLFRRSFPRIEVSPAWLAGRRRNTIPPPGIDFEVPIASLGRYFRTSRDRFPHHQGYLKPDPAGVNVIRERLYAFGGKLVVGLSWRGGTSTRWRGMRSATLEQMLAGVSVPGVAFVNLQYDTTEAEAEYLSRKDNVAHWPDVLADYDATAALVSELDLVVTVQTAVAHLAGALGRRVWVLLPHVPEWRYGSFGTDMPWYPSLMLCRQVLPGDWEACFDMVRAAMSKLAHSGNQGEL